MSEHKSNVVILPTLKRSRDKMASAVLVTLPLRDYNRLLARAKEWRTTPEDTAAYVIQMALAPARRSKS